MEGAIGERGPLRETVAEQNPGSSVAGESEKDRPTVGELNVSSIHFVLVNDHKSWYPIRFGSTGGCLIKEGARL